MYKKILYISILAVMLTGFTHNSFARGNQEIPTPVSNLANQETPEDTLDIFLPLILKPRSQTVFGVETFNFNDDNMNYADDANVYWVRSPFFSWKDIEPVKGGGYLWNTVNENGILALAKQGFETIGTIKYTPSWAQKYPGYSCGPVAQNNLSDFAKFVSEVVKKYSAYPYNIRYWELGNEPDLDPYANPSMPPDNVYGCWGDQTKTYYGGEYYATMLKQIYPAIKSVSPESKVLIGGLLLDCDPNNPPTGKTCKASKFLEGIFVGGGAPYFDIVSFHSYVWGGNTTITDENSGNWPNGGQVFGKVNFLRSVMSKYGVNKPLLMTEFAVICGYDAICNNPTPSFFGLKADGVVSSYVRSIALGLMGEIWYTLESNGWRHSGLFEGSNPTPGYDAMVFLTNEIFGANYNSEITGGHTKLRGYKFIHPQKEIQIWWARDAANGETIPVPPGVTKIYDRVGTPIEPIPSEILVVHPIYLEIPTQ